MRQMELLPNECDDTAALILFFNDLFDILNKRNYVPTDPQSDYAFLLNSVRCLEAMEFVKQTYFGGPIFPDTDSDENEQIDNILGNNCNYLVIQIKLIKYKNDSITAEELPLNQKYPPCLKHYSSTTKNIRHMFSVLKKKGNLYLIF